MGLDEVSRKSAAISSVQAVSDDGPRSHVVAQRWARWNDAFDRGYTVGAEEEVMLLDAADHALSQCSDAVLARLPGRLADHVAPETHAAVIELATGVHTGVAGIVAELARLRLQLADALDGMGLCVASAGTYPLVSSVESRVSGSERYRMVAESMRALARREPTLALHVHVGVPDPDDAIRVLNGLRGAVPLLLALSANSPFSQARDTGFASSRTVIFQGFPRTGTARSFADYADYVDAVDGLISSGALPDPSFLWWDVRLQPMLGTVEVRVMDAQSTVADSEALIALVQSLAHLELTDEPPGLEVGPEVLAENRFLAARDGLNARLIDPVKRRLLPVRELVEKVLERCGPHAAALGCSVELGRIQTLAAANGADRQRAQAADTGVVELVSTLSAQFASQCNRDAEIAGAAARSRAVAEPPRLGSRSIRD
jgi:glutamate---cysteine ligase / carboxylate-amine ligase